MRGGDYADSRDRDGHHDTAVAEPVVVAAPVDPKITAAMASAAEVSSICFG